MNTILLVLVSLLAGGALAAFAGVLWVRFGGWHAPDWLVLLCGKVPWASKPSFATRGAEAGEDSLFFVSRHSIAEEGLLCPQCGATVARRGDFTRVRRSVINGDETEVIKCGGTIPTGHDTMPCPAWLAASPDTEHGDHLNDVGEVDGVSDCPPDYYRFVRATPERVLREKYGVDVKPGRDGITADPSEVSDAVLATRGTTDVASERDVRDVAMQHAVDHILYAEARAPDPTPPTKE